MIEIIISILMDRASPNDNFIKRFRMIRETNQDLLKTQIFSILKFNVFVKFKFQCIFRIQISAVFKNSNFNGFAKFKFQKNSRIQILTVF
jgi:hypothetical protein